MSLASWLRSLFNPSPDRTLLRASDVLPESVEADECVLCFKDGNKSLLTKPGKIPEKLVPGEKCAVLSAQPLEVSVERDDGVYAFRAVAEPDDALAACLERYPVLDQALLRTLCANALDAVLPSLSGSPSPERLRARASVELMASGFRCVGLTHTPPEPAAPPEPAGDAAELAADLKEVEAIGKELGIAPPSPADTVLPPDRRALADRLKNAAADLEGKIRDYRRDIEDARSVEVRLGLPPEGEKAAPVAAVGKFTPVDLDESKMPKPLLVLRRSDIDDKLRAYIRTALADSIGAIERYQSDNLFRDLRLNGEATKYRDHLKHCLDLVETLPVLRHDFKYTRLGWLEVRRRVKAAKAAAAGAAAVQSATKYLCSRPAKDIQAENLFQDAEAGAASLELALRETKGE